MLQTFTRHYGPHFRDTIMLSIPVVIGQLGMVLMGVIDNIMIGDLGYEYLSAASLANSLFFIITVIGIGVTFAISPLVAKADASGETAECGMFLRQGVWVGLGTSIAMIALLYIGTILLPYMDQPQADVELGTPYLHIINISILPMLLFLIYKQFADGLSLTGPAMYITLLGLGFNTLTNWLLIYGNWGFPRLELDGAGYATLGSRIFMMVLMGAYVLYHPRFQKYNPWMRWRELEVKVIKKIVSIGLPSGMQYFFEVGAFGGAVIMIGWLGMEERSAHQVVISMCSVTYMIVTGFAAGATIRVGNALGRKDPVNMRRAGLVGIYLAGMFMFVSSVLFVLGRNWLPTLYVDDIPVLEMSAGLMIIAGFFQISDGVQAVAIGILRGIQDVRIPTWLTFIAYWVIALPLGYFLSFTLGWGLNGMWWAFVVSLMFSAVALTFRFWLMTQRYMRTMNPPQSSDSSEAETTPVTVSR